MPFDAVFLSAVVEELTPVLTGERIDKIQLLRILQDHGADRILFGTDSPWGDQKHYLEVFRDLPLFDDEREQILWKNAAQILEIPK